MNSEGTLTIKAAVVRAIPPIRGHAPVDGWFVAITVTDTGVGIPAADAERIFEPFFTTKRVGHGTGLGLSQVIGFAKQSGGDIQLESEVGLGTSFTLFLPQADTKPTEARRTHEDNVHVEGADRCVLVVEDNEQVGAFADQALRELGYRSVLAASADRALKMLEVDEAKFDIVFSDVVMPGTSGIELAAQIQKLYPNLPVVLTSGYSHVLAEQGSAGLSLLRKPYSIEDLARVLNASLQPV